MSVCLYKNYNDSSECTVCNVPFKLSNTFKRDDYVIYAWNTNPDGTGASYKLGEEFTSEDTSNLYAQWRKPIIPAYRIPIYGCIQVIDEKSYSVNKDSKEFSPIVANNYNELFRDTYGQVVPFKYSTVGTNEDKVNINCNSIFCNNNWSTCFKGRYHIYDGDLPYIDIQLLCQSDAKNNKLPTSMIPYDTISVDSSYGTVETTGDGDNSVTADNLCNALSNLVSYLKSNSDKGDKNFWIKPVPITN